MKKLLRIAPIAFLLLGTTAFAGEQEAALTPNQLHVGTGVICDTQDEVTDFVRLMGESDPGGAIQAVNQQAQNPLACGLATVAFHTGKDLGEVRNGKGIYRIMEIEVVAGSANGAWHMVSRTRQFTAVAVEGLDI